MAKLKVITAMLCLTALTGMGGKVEKFDWLASESAPEDYTMQIVKGDFIYPDGGSLYIPNGANLNRGWGTSVSNHVVGAKLKHLPNRVEITFFSYPENAFYQGSFELPYQEILRLFDAGYINPRNNNQVTYDEITAGVAPGGAVAVWLDGVDRRTEVFFGHAEKVELPWNRLSKNTEIPREEYVRLNLEDSHSPEVLESIKQNGIPYGLWDRYHIRYHWQPEFVSNGAPGLVDWITFYNGEKDHYFLPMDDAIKAQSRAIPDYLSYLWRSPEGQSYKLKYTFNEAQIFEAFQKLAPGDDEVNTTPLKLEIRIEDRDNGERVTNVWLKNDQETLSLQADIKIYKSDRWID